MQEIETVFRRERAGSFERAERLEIMFAVVSQGLGNCPGWFVTAVEDCERSGGGPSDRGRRAAGRKA